jgi:beta-lactamase regulating signal transducer with metallopeptidase domain
LFEPRRADERIGAMLPALATLGALLVFSALVRLAITLARHRREVRAWLVDAAPVALPGVTIPSLLIDSQFPIVAVIGVFRPRLVIAKCVLDACTADELRAVLDHECRHIARGDNFRRTLLIALPDALGWLGAGKAIDLEWHDASEEVADEAPGNDRGDAGRVALASALIRVAKMVPSGGAVEIPASALYRGEPLERRVRRLLDPIPPRPRAPRHYQWAALAAFIALSIVLLNPIHELLEVAVNVLP